MEEQKPNLFNSTPQNAANENVKEAVPEQPRPKLPGRLLTKLHNIKPITAIAIIALLMLLGTGAYFLANRNRAVAPSPLGSPEPMAEATNPTADWKTYTNNKIGISFLYPSETSSGKIALIQPENSLAVSLMIEGRDIFLFGATKYPNITLEKWIATEKNKSIVLKNIDFKDTVFQELKAKIAERVENGPLVTKELLIQQDKNVYLVDVSIFEQADISNQILSTFKFLEYSLNTEGNLTKYQDKLISFSYPKEWKLNVNDLDEGTIISLKGPKQVMTFYENTDADYGFSLPKRSDTQITVGGKTYSATKWEYSAGSGWFLSSKLQDTPFKLSVDYGSVKSRYFGYDQTELNFDYNFQTDILPVNRVLSTFKFTD